MYKTAVFSAVLAAALAYFLYLSPESLPLTSNLANFINSEDMALQSISRRVVNKVLAVETAEVLHQSVHIRFT